MCVYKISLSLNNFAFFLSLPPMNSISPLAKHWRIWGQASGGVVALCMEKTNLPNRECPAENKLDKKALFFMRMNELLAVHVIFKEHQLLHSQ